MRVFFVPVGEGRHLPYSEPGEGEHHHSQHHPHEGTGLFAGLVRRFREVLAAAERARMAREDPAPSQGVVAKVKTWTLRWIADRIAEQRLLWQLRGCHAATLIYPCDLAGEEALRLLKEELQRDRDRHLRWLVIDAALLVVSGLLALIPGPNVIAYYFAFRVVGHYLSMRGARQGLSRVAWDLEGSPALADLRTALRLDPPTRHTRVRDIAMRLELPHLATFVERVAYKGA
jgi:hypothetical protein